MCGIYLTNKKISEKKIRSQLERINFRGPDYLGYKEFDELKFGHLRLSIIDLDERSNQPMTLENYTIVFNGEIYNFKDIKKELIKLGYEFSTESDTEVLLNGFKEWGDKISNKLNGMFAFAIYNRQNKTIFCSRDRLGVKPFYYYWNKGEFEICSQLRPLSEDKIIDENAVSLYLNYTYIPSPFTIYQDVYKLQPGHNMLINLNDKSIKINQYWDLTKIKECKLTYNEAKDKLHNLLKDAVKIRLQADVPFGSFLSGGIDSALITSIASKISKTKINTFSIGFEDVKYDESKIASKYSKILNTNHTETICKPSDFLDMLPKLIEAYDEPFADSSALPSLLLNKTTKQYVTMALSGDGGDESFLGYDFYSWIVKFKKISIIPYFLRRIVASLIPSISLKISMFKTILSLKNENELILSIFSGFNSLQKNNINKVIKQYEKYFNLSTNSIQRASDINIKLWLENDSNVKVDRASMAFSVEVRSPFLDYRIVEFARTLPIKYRFENGVRKKILRDILNEYIPKEVFDQPKKGFSVPIGSWIRNELKDEFDNNLRDEILEKIPNLDIKKFKKLYLLHMNGKEDYSSYIWRVYIFSKWLQEFNFA
jgi:asparagine synthase (glutamine-hydrolysing)